MVTCVVQIGDFVKKSSGGAWLKVERIGLHHGITHDRPIFECVAPTGAKVRVAHSKDLQAKSLDNGTTYTPSDSGYVTRGHVDVSDCCQEPKTPRLMSAEHALAEAEKAAKEQAARLKDSKAAIMEAASALCDAVNKQAEDDRIAADLALSVAHTDLIREVQRLSTPGASVEFAHARVKAHATKLQKAAAIYGYKIVEVDDKAVVVKATPK